MKQESKEVPQLRTSRKAFTIIEILIVVATLAMIAGLLLPALTGRNRHRGSARISCVNNLKQVGLAFRIWANDNGDQYPMAVSETEGGALESVAAGNIARVFQVMSNELSVPKTIFCPDDWKNRSPATNWAQLPNTNISYFVGLDAVDTKPDMILSGDRDIAESGQLLSGLVNLTTNRPVAWHKLLHQEGGNVGLADGSVQQVTDKLIRQHLTKTGDATNRVLFPQ